MKGLGRHPNIVSMVACVTRGPHLCLVMDFCHHGDLRAYLRNLRQKVSQNFIIYIYIYTTVIIILGSGNPGICVRWRFSKV